MDNTAEEIKKLELVSTIGFSGTSVDTEYFRLNLKLSYKKFEIQPLFNCININVMIKLFSISHYIFLLCTSV